MKTCNPVRSTLLATALVALLRLHAAPALAHCDTLDGPVVKAARQALAEANVNPALIWVQKNDEPEIKKAFARTLAVRQLNAEAKELADRYFFETLVRIHRAGEGAPYTGLKPAGGDLGPAIPAGDRALETGELEPVVKLLTGNIERGLRAHFQAALVRKKFDKNDVAAGRAFVKAYVDYIHYVEGLHEAAAGPAHGHYSETHGTAADQPQHQETH